MVLWPENRQRTGWNWNAGLWGFATSYQRNVTCIHLTWGLAKYLLAFSVAREPERSFKLWYQGRSAAKHLPEWLIKNLDEWLKPHSLHHTTTKETFFWVPIIYNQLKILPCDCTPPSTVIIQFTSVQIHILIRSSSCVSSVFILKLFICESHNNLSDDSWSVSEHGRMPTSNQSTTLTV